MLSGLPMAKTSSAIFSPSPLHSFRSGLCAALALAAAAGCSEPNPRPTTLVANAGATGSTSGPTPNAPPSLGTVIAPAPVTPLTPVTPSGTGGTVTPSTPVPVTPQPVTPGSNQTPSTGVSGGMSTTEPEPCVDVEPPPDPEWPEATCASWAAETTACTEAWFTNYCDVSCGRCVPEGGGSTPTPEPEVCEDTQPPPDPEWPGADCKAWAEEADACGEAWFAEYCDVTCGRCVPAGGIPEPEPEVCEDKEPPPDPEWPGATCAEWSSETTACTEAWFDEYCDVSCGRCVPEGGVTPTQPEGAVDCSGEGLPMVMGGNGFATRYWDCCQPHCAQFDGHKCSQDGTTRTGDGTSSCNGGGSFACYDEAPRAVSDCLSYGYIAKANPNCGACYRIEFTGQGEHNASDPGSQLIKGKQMIVKVSNTGSDVGGNQFDLMIPGGGVGMFNACSRQWGSNDLGAQYGGFLTNCTGSHAAKKECVRQECQKIPAGGARDGCLWFVDWLQVADNPKFTSQQTDCPF